MQFYLKSKLAYLFKETDSYYKINKKNSSDLAKLKQL